MTESQIPSPAEIPPSPETPNTDPFAGPKLPPIRDVPFSAPVLWLYKGLNDMRLHPVASLLYGVAFAVMGWLLNYVLMNALQYFTTSLFGFFLLGPFLATGLYNISRQLQQDKKVSFRKTTMSWQYNLPAIAVYVLVLAVIVLIFMRASLITFALFYSGGMPTVGRFVEQLLQFQQMEFLIAYSLVTLFFSTIIFLISVVSIPLMMDKRTDAIIACITSLRVVAANPAAMLIWAILILLLIGLSMASQYWLLMVVGPVLGHATWHAYRATVV